MQRDSGQTRGLQNDDPSHSLCSGQSRSFLRASSAGAQSRHHLAHDLQPHYFSPPPLPTQDPPEGDRHAPQTLTEGTPLPVSSSWASSCQVGSTVGTSAALPAPRRPLSLCQGVCHALASASSEQTPSAPAARLAVHTAGQRPGTVSVVATLEVEGWRGCVC